jgi:hypothetical protein
MKGVQKSSRLSLLYHHKEDVLFKLFNSCCNISHNLELALFYALKMKQYAILVIYRVHNDAITLKDIFILYINSGTIFLALYNLSAILKISGYISYALFIRYNPASLKIDLLANFILKVSFFKDKKLYKMRHLYY